MSILSLLDLSAAFDPIDHNILITRLRNTIGWFGMVLDWYISYLSCCTQSVFVGHESTPSVLKCEVLQGYVLGPLLFTLYTHLLSTVICQSGLSYHFFADDSQLHKSSALSDFPVLACCLKDCIEDVAKWISDSKLKMNDDKTELLAIGTRSKLTQVIPNLVLMSFLVVICHSLSLLETLVFTQMKRCPWMHILNTCATFCSVSCAELEKVSSFLSTDAANKFAVSLIFSKLD